MTKDEQLKIYAAYLPYDLIVKKKFSRYSPTKTEVMSIDDLKTFGFCKIFKPILYDLSWLTKEIEHEGKVFTPIDFFEITYDHNSYPIEHDHGNIKLIRELKYIAVNNSYFDIQFLPYEVVQRLISWHFNVFGIPAGEFIDKSTLKTESND